MFVTSMIDACDNCTVPVFGICHIFVGLLMNSIMSMSVRPYICMVTVRYWPPDAYELVVGSPERDAVAVDAIAVL